MRNTRFDQLVFLGLLTACGGPGGGDNGDGNDRPVDMMETTTPPGSLSLVVPATAFVARQPLLQISGVGTHFAAGTTVDLGDPEIKISRVEAGSETNLRVQIESSDRARLGPHDISVTTPEALGKGKEERLSLRGGLTLQASLAADATGGTRTTPQGGLVQFSATNLDQQNLFLMVSRGRVSAGMLLLGVDNITPNQISGLAIVDPLAPPGGLGFTLALGDSRGQEVLYVLDPADRNTTRVTARTATPLTPGQTRAGEAISADMQGNLYKVTTTADNQVLVLTLGSLGAGTVDSGVIGVLSSERGTFSDGSFVLPSMRGTTGTMGGLLPKAGDYYLAVTAGDPSPSIPGFGYGITARLAAGKALPSLKEPATPDTASQPLFSIDLDGPYYGLDGAIDSSADEDFVLFKAQKTGPVYATAVQPGVPSQPSVGLFRANCTTQLAADRPTQQEAAVTAGMTYCVRVIGPVAPYRLSLSQDLP